MSGSEGRKRVSCKQRCALQFCLGRDLANLPCIRREHPRQGRTLRKNDRRGQQTIASTARTGRATRSSADFEIAKRLVARAEPEMRRLRMLGLNLILEKRWRKQGLIVHTAPSKSGGPFSLPPAPVFEIQKNGVTTLRMTGETVVRLVACQGGVTGIVP